MKDQLNIRMLRLFLAILTVLFNFLFCTPTKVFYSPSIGLRTPSPHWLSPALPSYPHLPLDEKKQKKPPDRSTTARRLFYDLFKAARQQNIPLPFQRISTR
jgi:hypothetical protein